jgi:hypothetical protein
MDRIIRIPVDPTSSLLVDLTEANDATKPLEEGPVLAARPISGVMQERILEAQHTLEFALQPIASASRSILDTLQKASPDEMTMEFGVEFTAEASAILARMGGNCHLKVSMVWKQNAASVANGGAQT